jgi:hypothetical protein
MRSETVSLLVLADTHALCAGSVGRGGRCAGGMVTGRPARCRSGQYKSRCPPSVLLAEGRCPPSVLFADERCPPSALPPEGAASWLAAQ